jgi:sulfite oxidase
MTVHSEAPFNAEPPRTVLLDDITSADTFYSRNHGSIPDISDRSWRCHIGGRVSTSRTIGFDELTREFDTHAVTATLQCAGNRRAELNDVRAIADEDLWESGAVSTARWAGARLADVLAAAGVDRSDDLHVLFDAPDVSQIAHPPQTYGSSIPLAKALKPEVLLAWTMNGDRLPRIHGGPVRVVVPGYIGARSVKWISAITVSDQPSENYFQASAYRILPPSADPDSVRPGDGISLSTLAITCDFLSHRNGDQVAAGPLAVSGYALAGDDRHVARVDVSINDGATWQQAQLQSRSGGWSWQRWSTTVHAEPGPLTLVARAFDDTAATQPESPAAVWNPKGYCNNSWPRLHLTAT